jgi:hypothetical protein
MSVLRRENPLAGSYLRPAGGEMRPGDPGATGSEMPGDAGDGPGRPREREAMVYASLPRQLRGIWHLQAMGAVRQSRPATVFWSGPVSPHLIPVRALAVALAAAATVAGCDAGNPRSCTVTCGDLGECPDGTSCGTDDYCYAPEEEPGSCSFIGQPDSAPGDDAGSNPDGSTADAARPDANVDRPDACAGDAAFADARSPGVAIPDDDPFGVLSVIEVDDGCVVVDTVEVGIDITHTFSGDIGIELTAPGGQTVVVVAPSGDSTDDINAFFPVVIAGGESAIGQWTLTVVDTVGSDTGTLNRWSIGINRPAP